MLWVSEVAVAVLAAEHAKAPQVPVAEDPAAAPCPGENGSMPRVLLIEDDRETATEVMAELAERGFEVDWAATGIEGLDKARSGDADVMIVDRLLPGVDGLTIIEVARQERVCKPVLVL